MGGYIIDTPGIKGFGLVDMEKEEIQHYFSEIFRLIVKTLLSELGLVIDDLNILQMISSDNAFLNHSAAYIQKRYAELVDVLCKIYVYPEIIEDLNFFLLHQPVQERILVRFLG